MLRLSLRNKVLFCFVKTKQIINSNLDNTTIQTHTRKVKAAGKQQQKINLIVTINLDSNCPTECVTSVWHTWCSVSLQCKHFFTHIFSWAKQKPITLLVFAQFHFLERIHRGWMCTKSILISAPLHFLFSHTACLWLTVCSMSRPVHSASNVYLWYRSFVVTHTHL